MRQKTEIKSGNKNKETRMQAFVFRYAQMRTHISVFCEHRCRNTSAFSRNLETYTSSTCSPNQLWIIVRHSFFGLPELHADENVPKKLWNEL